VVSRWIPVDIDVRNIGPGIALIQSGDDFRIEGLDAEGKIVTRLGFASSTALPSQEETVVRFLLENVDVETFFSEHRNDGEFKAWIPYSDINGSQFVNARIHAAWFKSEGEWAYHRIDYFRRDEEEPFAIVVFDAAVVSR